MITRIFRLGSAANFSVKPSTQVLKGLVLVAGIGLAAFSVPDAKAQRVVYQRVALSGMRFEDGRETLLVGSFGPPAISASGTVAYRSTIYGQNVSAESSDTIIRQRARDFKLIARAYQNNSYPAGFLANPNILLQKAPYSQFKEGTNYYVTAYYSYFTDSFDSVVGINELDQVSFVNNVAVNGDVLTVTQASDPDDDPTETTTQIRGQFIRTLLSSNNDIPTSIAISDWAYDPNAFNSFELPVGFYGENRLGFIGTTQPGGQGAVSGIYLGTSNLDATNPLSMTALAVINRPVPGLPIGTTFSALELPGINYGGVASTNATVAGNNAALFQGIWNYSSEREPGLFIGPTTAVPGTETGTFSDITSRVAMSPAGQMAFTATVADDPDLSGGLFIARLRNDGLNRNIPNNVSLLMPNGAIAPTKTTFSPLVSTDAVFTQIGQPAVNNRGTVAFRGNISGTGIVAGRNDDGIWAIVPRAAGVPRTPKPVIRTGDRITIDGRTQTVGVIEFDPLYGLNDTNQIVFSVTFLNGTSGVFKALMLPEI